MIPDIITAVAQKWVVQFNNIVSEQKRKLNHSVSLHPQLKRRHWFTGNLARWFTAAPCIQPVDPAYPLNHVLEGVYPNGNAAGLA